MCNHFCQRFGIIYCWMCIANLLNINAFQSWSKCAFSRINWLKLKFSVLINSFIFKWVTLLTTYFKLFSSINPCSQIIRPLQCIVLAIQTKKVSQIPISPWAKCCIAIVLDAPHIWCCKTKPIWMFDLCQPIHKMLVDNWESCLTIDEILTDTRQINAILTEIRTTSWLHIFLEFRFD